MIDVLSAILARKAAENARRGRHRAPAPRPTPGPLPDLRRGSRSLPHVIAEIKHRSPSAGLLRARTPGGVAALARAYEAAGASAVSVLADGPGFGGSPLDVRRAAHATALPVLFKEFVLEELQLDLAAAMGARLVLLIVRALPPARLDRLVRAAHARGLAPVVEAADAAELRIALDTEALIVGINARDLRSFTLDLPAALRALEAVPDDRVAVHMSGIDSAEKLAEVGRGRADAVLLGSAAMRAAEPGAWLRALLAGR